MSDPLSEKLAKIVDAAITVDWKEDLRSEAGGSGSYRTFYVWRLGSYCGYEPTREQARAAILRVAKIAE